MLVRRLSGGRLLLNQQDEKTVHNYALIADWKGRREKLFPTERRIQSRGDGEELVIKRVQGSQSRTCSPEVRPDENHDRLSNIHLKPPFSSYSSNLADETCSIEHASLPSSHPHPSHHIAEKGRPSESSGQAASMPCLTSLGRHPRRHVRSGQRPGAGAEVG